jgi:hypothetical protein
MNTQDHEVFDRNGKRVTRNGVLQDGDRLVARMNMMDAVDPGLVAAAALADAVKRNEQFDARGHRPGYVIDRPADADTARDQYHARTIDAWKTPPSATVADGTLTAIEKVAIVGPTAGNETLFAARDKAVSDRDKRISEAWRS